MPQSESCVPRRDPIRRHDPTNTLIRSCRPLLVHSFVDPAPHSPNSPNSRNSRNSPKPLDLIVSFNAQQYTDF